MNDRAVTVFSRAQGLSLLDAAAAYADAGLAVFPCVPGAKRPLTRHGFTDATIDPERVERWWSRWPEANIGVPTGRAGGFDVLDIDVHPGGSGFPALRRARQAGLADESAVLVRTPSGGLHLYFPVVDGRSQESWALPRAHVDFRGFGGYVIAPPSRVITESGAERSYRVIAAGRTVPPVKARELRNLLAPPQPGRRWPSRPRDADAGRSGERLGTWLAGQPEGNRNRALFWAACRQAEAGIPADRTRDALGPAAAGIGLADREIEATINSAYRALGSRRAGPVNAMARPGL